MPAAPDYAPSLAASGRRRPPQRATFKNSRLGFFGAPSGRTLAKRRSACRTAPGYRRCGYKTASGRPEWLSRDPLGEKAGINVYEYVGDDPINYNDPEGLEAPNYNPGAWNDNGTIQFSNNCYSYACNRPGPRKAPNKPQPGDSSGHPFSDPGNCAQVKAAAMSDGLKEPGKNGKCPCHFHLVKLYTSHNWNGSGSPDYHWYRQDSNGRWSSKHGWAPVGPQVDDPDADAKVTGYDNPPCGSLCAPD